MLNVFLCTQCSLNIVIGIVLFPSLKIIKECSIIIFTFNTSNHVSKIHPINSVELLFKPELTDNGKRETQRELNVHLYSQHFLFFFLLRKQTNRYTVPR